MSDKKSPKNNQEDSLDISMANEQREMDFNLDSFLAETPKEERDSNENETKFESGYFDDSNLISVVDNLAFDEIVFFDDKHLQDDDEIIDITDLTSEPTFTEPTFIEPTFIEPTFTEPTFIEPTFIEPTFTEPMFTEPMFSELSFELEQEPLISLGDDLATTLSENDYSEFGFGELNLDNEIDTIKVQEDLNLFFEEQKPVDALSAPATEFRDFVSDLSLKDNNIFLKSFLTGLEPALLNVVQKSVEETIEKVLEKKLDLIVKQCLEQIVNKIKND